MIASALRRNDLENRLRSDFLGLVHTQGTPRIEVVEGWVDDATSLRAPPAGADKEASHLFLRSAPSGRPRSEMEDRAEHRGGSLG